MTKWTRCDWEDEATRPKVPGLYAVVIEGDSERDGAYVFYDFGDYQTFAVAKATEEGLAVSCEHDEEPESIVAWYGPIDIPPCDCL